MKEESKHMECKRKCSKSKTNMNNKTSNLWICNKCLIAEELPTNIKFSNEDFKILKGTKLTTMTELKEMKSKHKKSKLWMHFNCRSLNNAYDELEEICNNIEPDVVLLTETWLDESNPKNAYIPEGYLIKRKDRTDEYKHKYGKKKGGGVAILHKENIAVTVMPSLNTEEEELLWIKVKDKKKTCLYACNYRASYCDQLSGEMSKLENNIVKASALSNNIIMFGDFN